MKILLASPIGKAGGIARWTEHILNYYKSMDGVNSCELDFLPMSHKGEKTLNSNNPLLRAIRGFQNYFCNIAQREKEMMKQAQYDLIHITSSASLSLLKDLYMIQIAHKHGVKALIHFRFGRIQELQQKRNWEWKLLCRVVRCADMVIVIDKLSYNTLRGAGFENVRLLPNPVAPRVLSRIDEVKPIERAERTLLFVGHGLRTKGIYELVDACRSIPNIKVKMLGSIEEQTKENLYKYSDYAEWLDVKGEIPYEKVIEEMCRCDVFVLPTYTEGFPNVILESMACGCAIVTTKVGAIPEMLEEEGGKHYGIMVEPRNVEQLRAAIEKMLSDFEFKSECRANAQQRVNERYNIDSVWKQMVAIWSETNGKITK